MIATWLDLAMRGGPVMIPIALGSIAALALIVNRTLYLLATRESVDPNGDILARAVDDRETVIEELGRGRGNVAALWRAGLLALPEGRAAVEQAMQIEGQRRIALSERGLTVLGTLITIEPMLGFLGTITGLIRAFMHWEAAGGDVQVSQLAGGIYEAMITTAAGLIIAIPYFLFYSALTAQISARARQLEIAHETFLQRLASVLAIRPASASPSRDHSSPSPVSSTDNGQSFVPHPLPEPALSSETPPAPLAPVQTRQETP